MNKKDLGIIHAVSTILFQWTASESTKKGPDVWVRPRRSEIIEEDEESIYSDQKQRINLSTKQIDEKWYFELWGEYWNDEYDEWSEPYIMAYIPIKDWNRSCWDMYLYCEKIDKLLEPY